MNATQTDALAELEKSLTEVGGIHGLAQLVQKATDNSTGFSTRQSLSPEVSDFTKRLTPLFDMLPREDVINPIHQWDAITSIQTGLNYAGPIDSVGQDSDPTITRYSENVRYYRTTTTVGQFTDSMSRPNLKAQVVVDEKAVQAVKYEMEQDIFNGVSGGVSLRGISDVITTFASDKVIDNLNAALTSTAPFDSAQKKIVENGGIATHFYFNSDDRISFKNLFTNFVRYNDPQTTNAFGYGVQQYLSSFGEVDVMWDRFIAAKTGGPAVSTAYILDITSWALGEPTVNGASGIAAQDLAKVGPVNRKLVNYYGLLMYKAPVWNALVKNIG